MSAKKVSCLNPWEVPYGKNLGLTKTLMGRIEGAEVSTGCVRVELEKMPFCESCGQGHVGLDCLSLSSLVSQLVTYVGFDFYLQDI